jgi:flagellar protein FlaI
MNIPKPLIAMTNVIMVMSRTEIDGKPARRTGTTAEIAGFTPETGITTEEVFHWNQRFDAFSYDGHSSILERQMKKMGITEEDVRRELNRRQTVLDWMTSRGIRRYTEVAGIIREYYANPDRIFQKARVGLK